MNERERGLVELWKQKQAKVVLRILHSKELALLAAETETGLKWYDNNCEISSYEYLLLLGKLKAPTLVLPLIEKGCRL